MSKLQTDKKRVVKAAKHPIRKPKKPPKPKRYTVADLTRLWEVYHSSVHTYVYTPCDANPGDLCSVTGFLTWLKENERPTRPPRIVEELIAQREET